MDEKGGYNNTTYVENGYFCYLNKITYCPLSHLNFKKMKTKLISPPFIAMLLFVLITSGLGCKKDEKSDEKQLLSLELQNSVIFEEYPRIEIDEINHIVRISVGYGYTLSNLSYTVEVSPLAQVRQKPSDLTNPAELTVVAEDGSEQIYTIIATKVTGGFAIEEEPNVTFVRQMRAIYRCTAANGSPDFNITLDHCDLTSPAHDEDFVKLILKNKSADDNLVGTYNVSSVNGAASCNFGAQISSEYTLFLSPFSGAIEITKHDKINKVISGEFNAIRFNDLFNDYPRYYIAGEFYNIPID